MARNSAYEVLRRVDAHLDRSWRQHTYQAHCATRIPPAKTAINQDAPETPLDTALPVFTAPSAPLVPVATAVTLAKKLSHAAMVADGNVYVDDVVTEPT